MVERLAAGDAAVYGVNTGVGLLADVRIAPADLDQLQRNVLRSHAAGVGDPLARAEVRAMMLIRANVLAKGFSGIRPVVAERLCDLLNRGVTPVVPSLGSVGASGDLAPLAHMALVLMGEGDAEYEGAVYPGGDALRRAGIEPLTLRAKEGISLINGTQAMLAIGCLELTAAEILADTADVICAMTLDALRGTPRAFDARLHEARPHAGQVESAARLRRLLEGSEIRQSHITCRRVQDAYSLRCAPQVHGAVRDSLAEARRIFAIELNSATDNPLVLDDEIVSGGNFHGQPLALQLDYLAVALTALSGIAERRIDRLVNPALNEELPPFLAGHAGLESGLDDGASDGRRAGGRESRAVPSGVCRIDHDQRQQRRLREYGDDRGAQVEAGGTAYPIRPGHRGNGRSARASICCGPCAAALHSNRRTNAYAECRRLSTEIARCIRILRLLRC